VETTTLLTMIRNRETDVCRLRTIRAGSVWPLSPHPVCYRPIWRISIDQARGCRDPLLNITQSPFWANSIQSTRKATEEGLSTPSWETSSSRSAAWEPVTSADRRWRSSPSSVPT